MTLFPNLDYKGLYNSLIPLIEVAPLIQYGLEGKNNHVQQIIHQIYFLKTHLLTELSSAIQVDRCILF